MKAVFDEKNIILNASFHDKTEAIQAAGKILVQNGYVDEKYIDDMLEREKVVSTYIGNNIAIPHGITESKERIKSSGISFIQVPDGVKFGEEIAYLVIGIAGKNNEHIDMLGNIAIAVSDMDNVEKLIHAKTKQEIIEVFKEVIE